MLKGFPKGNTIRRIFHKVIYGIKCKLCPNCHCWKSLDQFGKDKTRWDKYFKYCKSCQSKNVAYRRHKNPEKYRQTARKWRNKNLSKLRKYHRDWRKEFGEHNPSVRLNATMRTGIISSIKKGSKNGRHWETLVKYSLKELMDHLESQFKQGMSWDNYGEWHIDHKIPISSFHFNSPKEKDFLECWSLKNLQPLWKQENLSKGNKLILFLS